MYLVYTLTSLFDFGKYEGTSIREIISDNPNYINWCVENIPEFVLSAEAEDYYLALLGNHPLSYLFSSIDYVNRKYKAIENGAEYTIVRNENHDKLQ